MSQLPCEPRPHIECYLSVYVQPTSFISLWVYSDPLSAGFSRATSTNQLLLCKCFMSHAHLQLKLLVGIHVVSYKYISKMCTMYTATPTFWKNICCNITYVKLTMCPLTDYWMKSFSAQLSIPKIVFSTCIYPFTEISIGKTCSARILQWNKQPEGMT